MNSLLVLRRHIDQSIFDHRSHIAVVRLSVQGKVDRFDAVSARGGVVVRASVIMDCLGEKHEHTISTVHQPLRQQNS